MRPEVPSLRTSALLCGGIFALIVGLAALGNLAPAGTVRNQPWLPVAAKVVFLTLAVAFAFAFVPLMVNVVFGAQAALGNEARLAPLFRLRAAIVWTFWTIMGLGTLVAVPAAIWFGAFGDVQGALVKRALAHSQGILVAGIGMTVADMRRASTYDLGPEAGRYATISDTGIFDFRVATTPTMFRGCRLYFISLDDKTKRVAQVHVAIVPEKMSRPEIERFLSASRARLRTEGWRALDHYTFLRGDTSLYLTTARMDEWHSREAPDAEWIATIDLDSAKDAR